MFGIHFAEKVANGSRNFCRFVLGNLRCGQCFGKGSEEVAGADALKGGMSFPGVDPARPLEALAGNPGAFDAPEEGGFG